jgi:general secretion pathway protein A
MYLDFFGFDRKPFDITPDPEFIFLSPTHEKALGAINNAMQRRQGLTEIVGKVGVGKTIVLGSYLKGVKQQAIKTVVVSNPNITFSRLLESIYLTLDLEFPAADSQTPLIDLFLRMSMQKSRCNRNLVVVVDEAQDIPVQTLEQLCLLSDLDAPPDIRIQIVLVGQTELDQKLCAAGFTRSKAVRVEILPLTAAESSQYIRFRLSKVTNVGDSIFTKAALARIIKYSEGIPRKINIVCHNVLMAAFRHRVNPVSCSIVDGVIRDFDGKDISSSNRRVQVLTSAGQVLLAILLVLMPFRRATELHFKQFLPGPAASEKRTLPESDRSSDSYPPVEVGTPLPVMSNEDPAPAVILHVPDVKNDYEKALDQQENETKGVVDDQNEAPPLDRANAEVVPFDDTSFPQPEIPPESETTSSPDSSVHDQEKQSEPSSTVVTQEVPDQTAILEVIDEIIEKRSETIPHSGK